MWAGLPSIPCSRVRYTGRMLQSRPAKVSFFVSASLLVALLSGTPAHAEDFPLRTPLSELIRKEMSAKDVVGLSIAVVDDQKILWAEGFGYANRARRNPARADTLYAAGGLSQVFMAAAVMQWVDRGAVSLDQPAHQYVPEFSMRTRDGTAHPVTVRQLLSHHGGLPGMVLRDMWATQPEPLSSFVARLKNETAPFPPNTVFSPSFPGYDVLGRLIEHRCSHAFAQCLQEQLLGPLGMKHSTYDMTAVELDKFATHYWRGEPVSTAVVRDIPAAGLVTSVTDMAQLAHVLFAEGRHDGRAVLSRASTQELLRAQNTQVVLDLDNHVGLPWRLAGIRFPQARTVAWYSNESPFSRGRMVLVPEYKLAVVVLTNCSGSSEAVEKISERALELLLEQRKPAPLASARTEFTRVSPPPKREDIVGHYATSLGLITVTGDDKHYQARLLGKTLEIFPTREGTLAPAYHLLGVLPIPLDMLREARISIIRIGGQPQAIAHYRGQIFRLGDRIQPVKLSAAWQRRLGEYTAVERDPLLNLVKLGNVRLDYLDGVLQFRYRFPGWLGLWANVPVRPVSDTELVVEGTGWLMGESLKIAQRDGKEVLRYSGYEFRQVGRP